MFRFLFSPFLYKFFPVRGRPECLFLKLLHHIWSIFLKSFSKIYRMTSQTFKVSLTGEVLSKKIKIKIKAQELNWKYLFTSTVSCQKGNLKPHFSWMLFYRQKVNPKLKYPIKKEDRQVNLKSRLYRYSKIGMTLLQNFHLREQHVN